MNESLKPNEGRFLTTNPSLEHFSRVTGFPRYSYSRGLKYTDCYIFLHRRENQTKNSPETSIKTDKHRNSSKHPMIQLASFWNLTSLSRLHTNVFTRLSGKKITLEHVTHGCIHNKCSLKKSAYPSKIQLFQDVFSNFQFFL